jgi:glycosyltransferase involved in cell wall biosynthesis
MHLTVAICTWNRAALLDQTLEQMRRLRAPVGVSWELLVVNNNCTDDTDAVMARHLDHLPLRRLVEPTPGKSHACNTLVREAAGAYIVWTDDDVLVPSDWLEAYTAAFMRHPQAAVFGGPIQPWYEGTPPRWLQEAFSQVAVAFAALDLGTQEIPFVPGRTPYGANLAYRTDVLRKFPFDPSLGVIKGKRLNGEETTVIEAMLSAGHTGWWVPDAPVKHFIPRNRQSVEFLRTYYRGLGERLAVTQGHDATPRFLNRPRWLWRHWIESEWAFRWQRLRGQHNAWVEALRCAALAQGRLSVTA